MCTYKRTVGFLSGLRKAHVQHISNRIFHVVLDEIGQLLLQTVGINIMFYHHGYIRVLVLFILINDNDRFVVVGHFFNYNWGFVSWIRYLSEELLNLCFNFVNVNIAYNNDALMVRVIPFAVIIDKFLTFEVVDY